VADDTGAVEGLAEAVKPGVGRYLDQVCVVAGQSDRGGLDVEDFDFVEFGGRLGRGPKHAGIVQQISRGRQSASGGQTGRPIRRDRIYNLGHSKCR